MRRLMCVCANDEHHRFLCVVAPVRSPLERDVLVRYSHCTRRPTCIHTLAIESYFSTEKRWCFHLPDCHDAEAATPIFSFPLRFGTFPPPPLPRRMSTEKACGTRWVARMRSCEARAASSSKTKTRSSTKSRRRKSPRARSTNFRKCRKFTTCRTRRVA